MEVSGQLETMHQQQKDATHSDQSTINETSSWKRACTSFGNALHEILEVVLALGIVSIAAMFSPSTWLQSNIIFCAFFLVVFIIAMRYRRVTAYVAALLAAGSYSVLLWKLAQWHLSFTTLHLLIEPFLLLTSGIFISEQLNTQRTRLQVAEEQHVQKEEQLQAMKHSYEAIEIRNTELEHQRDGQTHSNDSISEKMLRLWELRGQEQQNAILDIVMKAVDAETCTLYMLRDGHMTLCASQQKAISEYTSTAHLVLDINETLISRTIERRQVCTIRDTLSHGPTTHRTATIMAGPLVDCHDHIIGVVVVDNIPLLKFSPAAVRLFSSILHMTSIALQTTIATDDTLAIPSTRLAVTEVDTVQTEPLSVVTAEEELMMQARTELALPAVKTQVFRRRSAR